ncbi:glycosyltransferase 61 family protein [Methylobacterium fujisawaense]|uniref:glycosyltransferase 61 family protein n=1 Tax=Methylobacterium fujisawaense TaxID=107400 RepID=UPI0031F5947C
MQTFVGFEQNVIEYNSRYEISQDPLRLTTYRNVYVLPGATTNGGKLSNIAGGVFDASGAFVAASAQPRFDGQSAIVPAQQQIPIKAGGAKLQRAVYGGIILDHFGHFLLESTCRLWAREAHPGVGYIFITPPGISLKNYHYEYLEALGISKESVYVAYEPTHVEELHVPESSIVYHSWVNRSFLGPFRGATVAKGFPTGKYFLSRAHLEAAVTIGEAELLDDLLKHGWEPIRIELLTAQEQIALFRSNSLIMGVQGSAFHNALFATAGQNLVHICRSNGQRSYFMLDKLACVNSMYINAVERHKLEPFGSSGPFLIDPEKVVTYLKDQEILSKKVFGHSKILVDRVKMDRLYSAWWHHQAYLESIYRIPNAEIPGFENASSDDFLAAADELGRDLATVRRSVISREINKTGYKSSRPKIFEALVDFPSNPYFLYFMSCAEVEAGFFEEAKILSKKSIELSPNNVLFRNHYIALLFRAETYDSAIEEVRCTQERGISDGMTDYLYSLLLEKKGEIECVNYARAAGLLMSDNLTVQRHILTALYKFEQFEEMTAFFADAPEIIQNDSISNFLISCGHEKLGSYDLAVKFASRAHELDSTNETIEHHLTRIMSTYGR